MIKIYYRVTKIAFWQFLLMGIISLGAFFFICYLLFLNRVMSTNELIIRFIGVMPIGFMMNWVYTRIIGYSLCDKGVSVGRVYSNGFLQRVYIKWEDALRIEYKLTSIKVLGTNKIIIYSKIGTKVVLLDYMRHFKEMLDTVQEKAKMHDIPFEIRGPKTGNFIDLSDLEKIN